MGTLVAIWTWLNTPAGAPALAAAGAGALWLGRRLGLIGNEKVRMAVALAGQYAKLVPKGVWSEWSLGFQKWLVSMGMKPLSGPEFLEVYKTWQMLNGEDETPEHLAVAAMNGMEPKVAKLAAKAK